MYNRVKNINWWAVSTFTFATISAYMTAAYFGLLVIDTKGLLLHITVFPFSGLLVAFTQKIQSGMKILKAMLIVSVIVIISLLAERLLIDPQVIEEPQPILSTTVECWEYINVDGLIDTTCDIATARDTAIVLTIISNFLKID